MAAASLSTARWFALETLRDLSRGSAFLPGTSPVNEGRNLDAEINAQAAVILVCMAIPPPPLQNHWTSTDSASYGSLVAAALLNTIRICKLPVISAVAPHSSPAQSGQWRAESGQNKRGRASCRYFGLHGDPPPPPSVSFRQVHMMASCRVLNCGYYGTKSKAADRTCRSKRCYDFLKTIFKIDGWHF